MLLKRRSILLQITKNYEIFQASMKQFILEDPSKDLYKNTQAS